LCAKPTRSCAHYGAMQLSSMSAIVGGVVSLSLFTSFDLSTATGYRSVAMGCTVLLLAFWTHCTSSIAKPAANAAAATARAKLDKALANYPDECAALGVTTAWYDSVHSALTSLSSLGFKGVALLAIVCISAAIPQTASEVLAAKLQSGWEEVLRSVAPTPLVVGSIFVGFVGTYWATCTPFVALDLLRPAAILPFKVQPEFVLTLPKLGKAVGVAVCNQALVLATLLLLQSHVLPVAVPGLLAPQLPSVLTLATHLLCSLAVAELAFFYSHRLMHTNEWLWTHVHTVHHSWPAPIALCCIYAHPIEFMMGNIPVVMLGPLLMGSHLSVWVLWSVLAIADTCIAHSGWHLPLQHSPEAHDYHHSSG
jgi:sterol desaturase/sphingolipid hydroxylase (fatty acid hydroxylase superfamily)